MRWLALRLSSSEKLYDDSHKKMNYLRQNNPGYTEQYFIHQWERQRESQLQAMVTESSQMLNKKLARLVELEEQHHAAE